jgi:hypothetical protein
MRFELRHALQVFGSLLNFALPLNQGKSVNSFNRLVVAALLSCAASTAFAQSVRVPRDIPWSEDAEIQRKVRDECVKLQGQLADYTQEFGREFGVDVTLADEVSADDAGRVLQMEIVEAVSLGNAFIGHRKYTRIRGTLFEDGQRVAAFQGMRTSMGGAFAGYKGSCSVLGRTVKALGKDVAMWLKDPKDEAELGDF